MITMITNYYTNYSLDKLNTLRLKSKAACFMTLEHIEQMPEVVALIRQYGDKYFVLGGGSNIILPELYSGVVIQNKLLGTTVLDGGNEYGSQYARVRVMAGVMWDNFVAYTLNNELFGLENLSLIPGTVGAAPIQNIGAYGVEAKDFIEYVEAYDLKTQKIINITNSECEFSYRDSIFKHTIGERYIILAVVWRLRRSEALNYSYGDIKSQMELLKNPTAHDLRQCIIRTRQSKLPNPEVIGNVGSFFHNPVLNNDKIEALKQQFPDLPTYLVSDKLSKISAGWLIDKLGLKGYRDGNIGIYEKQALVIVNYARTSLDNGDDVTQKMVLAFAHMVQDKVYQQYKVKLNIEPIILK